MSNSNLYRVQYNVQRISFDVVHSVETLEDAKEALSTLINRVRVQNLQK